MAEIKEEFEVDKSCPKSGCGGTLESKGNHWQCDICGEIVEDGL